MSSLTNAADTIYALRFLRLLTMPWEDTDAYKTGVVDEKGKILTKPKTKEQKEAYTIFHRLVFNVKRLLPNSKIATYGSALFLIREFTNLPKDDIMLLMNELGVDTSSDLQESFFVKNDQLLQGEYILRESIASPTTGEVIAKKGTKVKIDESLDPVDNIGGVHIYKVQHKNTNQMIYISQEDITR